MPLDAWPFGDEPHMPVRRTCIRLVTEKKAEVKIAFQHDADRARSLTGSHHQACGKPIQSLARVINMRPIGS